MLLLIIACQSKLQNDTSEELLPLTPFDSIGPFAVGHHQIEHTYIPFENQPQRTIIIDVWYPTNDQSGEEALYLYGTDDKALEGATPAQAIHPLGYPIHLHSHGYQGWGATSAFLMRYFASHGWISVAPNHTNNLLGDHQDPLATAHFIHRPMDLSQSLDVVEGLDLWPSSLDMNNVLMSGHSFGASYSTWAIAGASYDQVEESCRTGEGLEQGGCSEQELSILTSGSLFDQRIKAAIPLAGTIRKTFFGDTGYQSVTHPILFISGTQDNHDSAQAHFDEINNMDFSWLSLSGGCHQTFALGQCTSLDVELGFSIVQTYSLAFARKHIINQSNDDIDGLLSGQEAPWAEAVLQLK